MNIKAILPIEEGMLNVIIETPRHSRNKYNYDPGTALFKFKKVLPLGMSFPYDFGFVPNTLGGDGDPLDVLVLMDEPAYPGCLVQCRAIGILVAEQKEKVGDKVRNDRIVAVTTASLAYDHIKELEQLGDKITEGIVTFFIDYNKNQGKVFTPLRWESGKEAIAEVKKHTIL